MNHLTILSHQYLAIISPFISPPLITIISLTIIMSPFHQYLTIVSPVSHQYLTSISPVSHGLARCMIAELGVLVVVPDGLPQGHGHGQDEAEGCAAREEGH